MTRQIPLIAEKAKRQETSQIRLYETNSHSKRIDLTRSLFLLFLWLIKAVIDLNEMRWLRQMENGK